jgi:hypothetical protein
MIKASIDNKIKSFKKFYIFVFLAIIAAIIGLYDVAVKNKYCVVNKLFIDRVIIFPLQDKENLTLIIDLKNALDCEAQIEGIIMSFGGGLNIKIIDKDKISNNKTFIIEWPLSGPITDCKNCDKIYIGNSYGQKIDEVYLPELSGNVQAFQRINIHDKYISLIEKDVFPIVRDSGLSPQDSSQNAIVKFNGYFWILSGYSKHDSGWNISKLSGNESKLWYSTSKTWNSSNGITWSLVNESPPYHPYSSFIAFNGKIWALGPVSFSTNNGINWSKESLSIPVGSKSIVFDDEIYIITGGVVLKSKDGVSFVELTKEAPWGNHRHDPVFLSHDHFLWVIGGNNETIDKSFISYKNDVWRSRNGTTWELVSKSSPWEPRRWHNAISSSGLLWILNGYNHSNWPDEYGNIADLWNSKDGKIWNKIQTDAMWAARHAAYIINVDNSGFIVIAGYGHNGVSRLYSDVWFVKNPNAIKFVAP